MRCGGREEHAEPGRLSACFTEWMLLQSRAGRLAAVVVLVAYPLLILCYWLLYPAYGETSATAILHAIDAEASRTQVADAFAYAGAFLGVAASVVLMTVLAQRGSRVGWLGGLLSAAGWVAVVSVLTLDLAAVALSREPAAASSTDRAFHDLLNSPLTIALEIVATLHVLGGVLIGVGLFRTRMIPVAAAVIATVAPAVHLAANLLGLLWVDELTWVALAVVYGLVGRTLLVGDREPAQAAPAATASRPAT